MPVLFELFFTFAKIGLFTFGGGYAMISLIENICVENKKWITHDEMMTVAVIAESTPGPIAINCATYVGYKKGKLQGAIAATLGVVLPSFIIIYLISRFLDHFLEITWVFGQVFGTKQFFARQQGHEEVGVVRLQQLLDFEQPLRLVFHLLDHLR